MYHLDWVHCFFSWLPILKGHFSISVYLNLELFTKASISRHETLYFYSKWIDILWIHVLIMTSRCWKPLSLTIWLKTLTTGKWIKPRIWGHSHWLTPADHENVCIFISNELRNRRRNSEHFSKPKTDVKRR